MLQTSSLALLGAMGSVAVAAAGSLPRGVGPEFASYYQTKDHFNCISNAAIKLSWSQVNDNTCDCPDGSDEPGTAACASLDPLSPAQPLPGSTTGSTQSKNVLPGFWCENKGHVGMYVPFMYVNDGVCDYDLCCDGTEEFAQVGGVKCQNKCAEIGKEHRRLEGEKRAKMERAGNKRKEMIRKATEIRGSVEAELAQLTGEISRLEAERDSLQKEYDQAAKKDRGKVVGGSGEGGKLGVLVNLAKARVTELRNTLISVVEARNDLQKDADELREILRKLKEEYNPNFNDEGVKAAVKSWEDFAAREATEAKEGASDAEIRDVLAEDSEENGVNWKAFDELESDDTEILYSIEAYLPPFLREMIRDKIDALRDWCVANGLLADKKPNTSESAKTRTAREALESAERDLSSKKRDLERDSADLKKDYGPSDIFRALKDTCVSVDSGEYTYELCYLGKTSQKSKKGHGNTNMGNFEMITWANADEEERLDGKSLGKGERMVLKYEDGQSCWNGPRRRTEVWLGCAEQDELWRVSESEKCVYKMEVGTPAACESVEGVGEPKGKDEL